MKSERSQETAWKRKVNALEGILQKPSKAAQNASFPSWESVQSKPLVYVDFSAKQKKRKETLQLFVGSFGLAGSILAASLFFSVFLSTPREEVPQSQALGTPVSGPPTSIQKENQKVEVVVLVGNGVLEKPDGTTTSLTRGMVLEAGDRLVLEKKARIEVKIEEQVYLKTQNQCILVLLESSKDSKTTDTRWEIQKGKVSFSLLPMAKQERFSVVAGLWKTEVRGTTFSVEFDPDLSPAPRVAVAEGSVAVSATAPEEGVGIQEIILESSQALVLKKDSEPEVLSLAKAEAKALLSWKREILSKKESELFQEFQRWELVRLDDGRVVEGVILGQTNTELRVLTREGEVLLPISQVVETEKIR